MTDDFARAFDDRFASNVMVDTPPVLQIPSMDTPPDPVQPEAPEVTEKQLLLDPQFAAAARDVHLLFEGKPFEGDDQMAARYGIDAIGEFNYNFAGPAGIPGESGISSPGTIGQAAALMTSGSQDQAKSFIYLMDRYDQLPNFTLAGTARMIRGMVADPSVYTGFGTLGAGFLVRKTGATGIKKALVEIAKRPGTSAAVYTGVEAGAADQLTQGVERKAGIEIDPATGALRTALTAGVAGAMGGGVVKGGEMLARELGPAVGDAISQAGQSAEARMAERGPITDRLMSGGDPMDVIDPALAAAGKLARPTKENPVTAVPPTETEPGIIAFHGSGADFDQFSLEKIGTGEGAQAYGYGLYFTDSEDIAKFYKDMMARNVDIDGRPYIRGNQINDNLVDEDIADDLGATNGDLEAAIKSSEEFLQEMIDEDNVNAIRSTSKELEKLKALRGRVTVGAETGKTYKVALSPKPDELLDYDAPFSEQSKDVQEKLIKAGYKVDANTSGSGSMILDAIMSDIAKKETAPRNARLDEINIELKTLAKEIDKYSKSGYRNFTDPKGKAAAEKYDALMDERANLPKFSKSDARKIASEKIAKAGIPGIKYKAAGSRGAAIDEADVEKNYVIFDDKAIKILEKYGIVGPVAITALGAAKQDDNKDSQNVKEM